MLILLGKYHFTRKKICYNLARFFLKVNGILRELLWVEERFYNFFKRAAFLLSEIQLFIQSIKLQCFIVCWKAENLLYRTARLVFQNNINPFFD